MAANIYDLSTTPASNTTIDSIDVSGTTGKVKDGDNAIRSIGSFMAQWVDDQGGIVTTTGSANAHAVTLASGVTAYATGLTFRVKFGYTNTSTTVNLNVNSIGNKRVKVNYGGLLADPIPGDIQAGAYGTFLYDGTYLVLLDAQQQGRYPPGHLQGLTLSNNGSDATNDIDIAVGTARSSDDSANIDLLSALTKRLDAAWAVGTNQGMLATGAAVTNTTYYLFLIKRPDTGVVDVAADTSSTGANIATNTNAAYTLKTLLGTVTRSGGVNGTPYLRYGQHWAAQWAAEGQLKFPATQNASSDANTLDDYKESDSWTPTIGFSANGNLSVSYSAQAGAYTKVGRLVTASFSLTTSSFTHTTASGSLQIIGLPIASKNISGVFHVGALSFQGITKSSYTSYSVQLGPNSTTMTVNASGSGQNLAGVGVADVPTGGVVALRGTITYFAD